MKLIKWLIRSIIRFLRVILIPMMGIILTIAGFFTITEIWAYVNPNKVWGYSTEDAAFDQAIFWVLVLLWDRFFGPYGVTLRKVAKLIERHEKERQHG